VPLVSKEALQKAYDDEVANLPKFGGKISELCKYVWAGSLAIAYALVTTEKPIPAFSGTLKFVWVAAAGVGAVALLLDYLQYLSAFFHARNFVRWIETVPKPIELQTFNANTVSFFSRANSFFFWAKNAAVFASAALIAIAVIGALVA
jgi:hypothetical protein